MLAGTARFIHTTMLRTAAGVVRSMLALELWAWRVAVFGTAVRAIVLDVPMLSFPLFLNRLRSRGRSATGTLSIDELMLLVVAVMVVHCSLHAPIARVLSLEHGKEILRTTNEMDGTRSLHLVVRLGPFLLLSNTVFLQEQLILHVELSIVTNRNPRSKTMPVNADEKCGVLFSSPCAAVVGGLGGIWKAE